MTRDAVSIATLAEVNILNFSAWIVLLDGSWAVKAYLKDCVLAKMQEQWFEVEC